MFGFKTVPPNVALQHLKRFFVLYCCPTAATAPTLMAGGLLKLPEFRVDLQRFLAVGAVGLEPTWPCGLRILSPVRLPIPPRPRVIREYTSQVFWALPVQQAS